MSFNIVYNVDINRLDETIEKIFTQIPEEAQKRIFDEVVWNVETALKVAAPKRDGGLSNSITTKRMGKFEAITGPTKKVDGYDLGLLLERGSKGGQKIRGNTGVRRLLRGTLSAKDARERATSITERGWMKFFWKKTGQTHYAQEVTRGSIAPRRWVRKTVTRLVPEIKRVVNEIWRSEYERNAT